MKFLEAVERTGRIPTYDVKEDIELLSKLPKSKPSTKIIQTKKGLDSIALLEFIKKNKNHSWYSEIYDRNKNNMDSIALFYRGNKITYRTMFSKADQLAKSLLEIGINREEEIPCCLANTPELLYVMLAANKIGAKLNLFGSHFDKKYLESILNSTTNKVIFASDDFYGNIVDVVNKVPFEKKVLISLADSLPDNPQQCTEYIPELDNYYHYNNLAIEYKEKDNKVILFNDFIEVSKESNKEVIDSGTLDDDFCITYTSGSTKEGMPKAMIHANRSYIVGGIFNTSKLTGTPTLKDIRSLAHIHSDSNTNLITSISDTLMKCGEVALEPTYDKKSALDVLILNNPVLYTGTTSFLVEAAKQYLIEKKFNNGNNKKILGKQLVTIAVGEKISSGEEKLINKFLRKSKAGSEMEIYLDKKFPSKIKIPYSPVSYGGGDTEHGGLFYTLQGTLKKIKYFYKGKGFEFGLEQVPFAVTTALKLNEKNEFVECDYNEDGIIVANSITNMVGYKNNREKTINKIIRDSYGRDWLSCGVIGRVNELGNVIIKGRTDEIINNANKELYPLYLIDDVVCKDINNVLSCTTTNKEKMIINLEFYPFKRKSDKSTLKLVAKRCEKFIPIHIYKSLNYRIIDFDNSFPLTSSGKRSIKALELLPQNDVFNLSEERSKTK